MGRKFGKVHMLLGILSALLIVFPIVSSAQEVITNRSGTIRITTPEGRVFTVTKDQPLPAIPSGSTIEILEGKVDISPREGFVKVIVSGSAGIIEGGEVVIASLDPMTGNANYAVISGEIEVISGNTTVKLNKWQEAQINFNKTTGVAEIKSIKGEIETITVGIKTLIMQGAVARINVDPKTRVVHVKSAMGELHVTSLDGKVFRVTEGESMETEGAAEGEIQTFGEGIETVVPEEEPVEPERPEASPHRP